MVNVFHRKIRVNDGYGVLKVETSRLQTRNVENRQKFRRRGIASKDEYDSQTRKQLGEQLGVSQQVSNRLREMGKPQIDGYHENRTKTVQF